MSPPRYKGDASVRERDGSPRILIGAEETTGTRVYLGQWAELFQHVPPRGHAYDDLPIEGLRVVLVEIVKTRGGLGEMTVSLSTRMGDPGSPEQTAAQIVEVEWGILEKPIEQAPRYGPLAPADFAHVAAWEQLGPDAAQRRAAWNYPTVNQADPGNPAHWAELQGLALELAQKKAKGIEAWMTPAPIVRRTRDVPERPAASRCGRRDTPPVDVTGYQWVKTSDRSVREGTRGPWQRVEEWTGAETWDPELYPHPS